MLLLMLVHVIAGAVSAVAGPSRRDLHSESPLTNNVPGPTNYAEDHLVRLQQEQFEFFDDKAMVKRYISNKTVTCNDGSPSGFYIRPAQQSKRWIVFLEGGWYCYDQRSCHNRWMNLRHLMSSKLWPPTRSVGGILSMDPIENPYWWNAHHVLVPYCTSDTWSGTRVSGATIGSRFSFQGARVVRQVILDLLPLGLVNASTLLLAGSSAGGTGVLLNLNAVHSLLHDELALTHIAVRGIADSGWFLDREPYSRDAHSLAPVDAVRRGVALWQGKVPPMCAASYPNEPWRCYFGYRIYPFLTAPLFVFQWLFDEAQMTADNVGPPVTKQQWDYIHKMGDSLRHSFENVSAVFAPSCISHSVLTKKDWYTLKVNDITLPQALRCWDLSFGLQQRPIQELYLLPNQNGSSPMLADAPLETHRNRAKTVDLYKTVKEYNNVNRFSEKQKRRRNHKKKKPNGRRRKGLGRKNKNRPMRSPSIGRVNTNSLIGGKSNNPMKGCHRKLIDKCTWPQCNHKCPKLHNPFTGEEMDFIELLKSFGLDMASVANALGIDIHTLNNMGHAELLDLLTQQNNR